MSYLVLARKWRPQRFADLVGQEHVVRSLSHALDSGRVGHAFLFSGSRGVGKTTVGRILAKGLNCEKGVTAEPCGECDACRGIEEGRFVDLVEVDAASRTKVDDTRALLDNVAYAPTSGRYKVYLVDEVHMLSGHSFNALLKTLEEPPEHVKFIFATTEPARLPVTILSRCLQFELGRIPAARIRERLAGILDTEGLEAEGEALDLLARAADGSLRDALSLMDQAINFGGGTVAVEPVRAMLGTVHRDRVLDLLEAVADRDGGAVLAAAGAIADTGVDLDAVLAELLRLLHRITVLQAVPGREEDELETGLGAAERDRLMAVAQRTAPEDVQLFYQLGLQGRHDLPSAPDPRVGLEMALLRMVGFRPFPDDGAEAPSVAEVGQAGPEAAGEAPAAAANESPPWEPAPDAAAAEANSVQSDPAPRPAAPEPAAEAPPSAGESHWQATLGQLSVSPMWQSVLEHGQAQAFTAERVVVALPSSHKQMADSDRFRQALGDALEAHFGARPRLEIEDLDAKAAGETPAAARERRTREAQEAAETAVREDGGVGVLRDQYGAEVESVEPDTPDHPEE
jgi:DNA polymerase-3 subunit gamma/tau